MYDSSTPSGKGRGSSDDILAALVLKCRLYEWLKVGDEYLIEYGDACHVREESAGFAALPRLRINM
jgi:hypothetical protein